MNADALRYLAKKLRSAPYDPTTMRALYRKASEQAGPAKRIDSRTIVYLRKAPPTPGYAESVGPEYTYKP